MATNINLEVATIALAADKLSKHWEERPEDLNNGDWKTQNAQLIRSLNKALQTVTVGRPDPRQNGPI